MALTTLVACGLYLVMALEAGGSRRRSTLVAVMCAVMAALYVGTFADPRHASLLRTHPPRYRHGRHGTHSERGIDRRPFPLRVSLRASPAAATRRQEQPFSGRAAQRSAPDAGHARRRRPQTLPRSTDPARDRPRAPITMVRASPSSATSHIVRDGLPPATRAATSNLASLAGVSPCSIFSWDRSHAAAAS